MRVTGGRRQGDGGDEQEADESEHEGGGHREEQEAGDDCGYEVECEDELETHEEEHAAMQDDG